MLRFGSQNAWVRCYPRIDDDEEYVQWDDPWSGLDGFPTAAAGVEQVRVRLPLRRALTLEVRVLKARGTLVKSGVHAPGRWEWSPVYFKEINWVGSNAFGIEEVDGVRKHGIEHYLDLVRADRVDLGAMLTHTFALSDWRAAFLAIADQERSGAVKVALDPQR